MSSLGIMLPILPGKTEALRRFSKEALGPRLKEQEETRRATGLTKEMGWIQPTPMGEVFLVYLEGNLPEAVQEFGVSKHPYDVWFKDQIRDITGVDFNQPPPGLPELVFDWQPHNL